MEVGEEGQNFQIIKL